MYASQSCFSTFHYPNMKGLACLPWLIQQRTRDWDGKDDRIRGRTVVSLCACRSRTEGRYFRLKSGSAALLVMTDLAIAWQQRRQRFSRCGYVHIPVSPTSSALPGAYHSHGTPSEFKTHGEGGIRAGTEGCLCPGIGVTRTPTRDRQLTG